MKHKPLVLLVTAIIVLITGLTLPTVCQPQEYDLPFETIERNDASGTGEYYEDKEPRLVIITDTSGVDTLGNTVSLEAQARLQSMDFDRYFVIAVFQGWRPEIPTPQSGAEVYGISRKGNTMTIYAYLYEPVEGHVRLPMDSSPYHLVKVQKEENWNQTIHFTLYIDGTEATSLSHFIP